MKMKKLWTLALAIGVSFTLVACGGTTATAGTSAGSTPAGSEPKSTANAGGGTAAPADAFAKIFAEKPNGKELIVVTNNASNGRDVWLKEHATQAGFNIQVVDLGGGAATARVISEVNNPTTNVIWGPSEDQFTAMVEANALTAFTPAWAEDVKGSSALNGFSWPYEVQPKLLLANPDVYTLESAPKSYKELWENPAFHGKYAVPTSFDGNTNRAIIGGILAQYLDPNGELGVSKEGWEAIAAYFKNGYKTPKGENDFGNMASGKVPITFSFASGLKGKIASFKVAPLIIYTEVGEPSNTNQLGVVNNKDQAVVEESMRFANWLGSAEVIGAYANANGNIVANKKAVEQMDPMMKEIAARFKPQAVDWAYVNSMMDQWVAKIQLEFY